MTEDKIKNLIKKGMIIDIIILAYQTIVSTFIIEIIIKINKKIKIISLNDAFSYLINYNLINIRMIIFLGNFVILSEIILLLFSIYLAALNMSYLTKYSKKLLKNNYDFINKLNKKIKIYAAILGAFFGTIFWVISFWFDYWDYINILLESLLKLLRCFY